MPRIQKNRRASDGVPEFQNTGSRKHFLLLLLLWDSGRLHVKSLTHTHIHKNCLHHSLHDAWATLELVLLFKERQINEPASISLGKSTPYTHKHTQLRHGLNYHTKNPSIITLSAEHSVHSHPELGNQRMEQENDFCLMHYDEDLHS